MIKNKKGISKLLIGIVVVLAILAILLFLGLGFVRMQFGGVSTKFAALTEGDMGYFPPPLVAPNAEPYDTTFFENYGV
ncbi:MAG: hypothetical protein ABIJ08_01525, partial [Nanoarchaeota archaeon]